MKHLLPLLFLISITTWAADVKSGLVLHYSFDKIDGGIVQDDSGHANDGRIFNALPQASGVRGGCLSLDGKTAYVQAVRNPTASPEHTVAMWFKPAPERIADLYDCQLSSMNRRYNLGFWTNGPHYHFFSHCLNASAYGYGALRADSCVFDLMPGRWYHAAMVIDDGGAAFYLNGRRIGFTTGPGANRGDRELLFGACDNGQRHGYFPGLLDEIRIYDRALTDDDMAGLFRQDAPADLIPPAPVALGPSYVFKNGQFYLRSGQGGDVTERALSEAETSELLARAGRNTSKEKTAQESGPVCEIGFSNDERGDQDVTFFMPDETLHVRVRDVDISDANTNLAVQVFLSQRPDAGAAEGKSLLKQLDRKRHGTFRGQIPLGTFHAGSVWVSVVASEPGGQPLLMRSSRIELLDKK